MWLQIQRILVDPSPWPDDGFWQDYPDWTKGWGTDRPDYWGDWEWSCASGNP